jgi:hypothetical protein
MQILIISEDVRLGLFLSGMAAESDDLQVLRVLDQLPRTAYEVARMVHCLDPDILVVAKSPGAAGLQAVLLFREHVRKTPMIVFGPDVGSARRPCERAGIYVRRGFPATPSSFALTLAEAVRHKHTCMAMSSGA